MCIGLDHGLRVRIGIKNWGFEGPDGQTASTIKGKKLGVFTTKEPSSVEYELFVWRKSNHIHRWFVDNCQDGEDDCRSEKVSWEKVKEFYFTAERVLEELNKKGTTEKDVYDGESFSKEEGHKILTRKAKLPEDTSPAERLMPTASGFFFGSTEYDSYYIDSLKNVVEVLKPVVESEDPDFGSWYYDYTYWSSW